MKSLTKFVLALGMAFALTACGGGSLGGDDYDDYTSTTSYGDDYTPTTSYGTSIYADNLYNGYRIDGTSSYGESVSLYFYSDGTYEYYRGSEYFYGSYTVDSSGILMRDYTDGGSYYLYSDSYGQFSEGGTYSCPGLGRELYISSIQTL
jgi:hypothetical protein